MEKKWKQYLLSPFYLVWITRPWHLRELFMRLCAPRRPRLRGSHCGDPGRYQSLAHGIFIFSVTRDCAGSDTALMYWEWLQPGFNCSQGDFRGNHSSPRLIFPRLYQLRKIGCVAFRSVSPLNSTYVFGKIGIDGLFSHPWCFILN